MQGRIPLHVNTANRGPSVPAGVHLGMTTIAEVLGGAGYTAHQVGKWRAYHKSASADFLSEPLSL